MVLSKPVTKDIIYFTENEWLDLKNHARAHADI